MYPAGTSDPNLMSSQDFVAGKKSNYYLLRSLEDPMKTFGASGVKVERTNSVDGRVPRSGKRSVRIDYVAVSKTRRRRIRRRFDNRSEGDKAYSQRFNEELPQKSTVIYFATMI